MMQRPSQHARAAARRRFLSDISGNLAVMTAITMPAALVLAAFAIEEGALYAERRHAQSLVDLAAITAAANLDKAVAAVLITLLDNGMHDVVLARSGTQPGDLTPTVTVEPGRYVGTSATAPDTRFSPGARPFNAVRVTFQKLGTRRFGNELTGRPLIGAQATASVSARAGLSIGGRGRSVLVQ
ncbi:pilus assembly protein TadG-related protein [Mesorhizobium sp. KR2-14]|uniref:pilus assembly protein TadG-related protein n=1 Tax=Mesorhizobium sp. KR2-14 TaxID=3156610 RepID=UPI0032B393EF